MAETKSKIKSETVKDTKCKDALDIILTKVSEGKLSVDEAKVILGNTECSSGIQILDGSQLMDLFKSIPVPTSIPDNLGISKNWKFTCDF